MMEVNVTRLQESLYDFYNFYNLTFALSVVTCPSFIHDNDGDFGESDDALASQEENGSGLLHSFASLFSFVFQSNINSTTSGNVNVESQEIDCMPVLNLKLNQRCSTYVYASLILTLFLLLTWFCLRLLKCIFRRLKPKKFKRQKCVSEDEGKGIEMKENFNESNMLDSGVVKKANDLLDNTGNKPIRIHFPLDSNNVTAFESVQTNMDQIFSSTLSLLLKQIDSYLGFEIQRFIDERYAKPSSPTQCAVSNGTGLQSPRVRKKWNLPQDISPSILRNSYANEKNLRHWMTFENICRQVSWIPPKRVHNQLDNDKNKEKDESLLQFLRQNCVTKLIDWNLSVLIVNYSLFLLDQMLKSTSETDKSNEALRLVRFESTGSASDGTLSGKPDHFDVMFVFEFNQATDLNILHNNYCNDISPGHVVIGVNNIDNRNALKTNNCLHKAQIQDKFGFYLLCNQVEKMVDGMLKKAVRKLNSSHKYKMERLPFSLNMSSTKNLELTIDTSIFTGMGIEIPNISVNVLPSICIESSEFTLLPKLYAVPTWRADHRKSWEEKEKRVGALSKLFPRSNSLRLPSNLLWSISVSKLETDIRKCNIERFHKSDIESCHEECLMVLKALFCSRIKTNFLSKGEINSYVLSTVVSFLLMESSSSAWKKSQLLDRVSDAVHFLRSAYTNIWLPNFVIHNPHLSKKIPTLAVFSALLTGRQQNLLADLDSQSALKTLAYIDLRLKETGLSKILKDEYSDEMWEYEFFLFG